MDTAGMDPQLVRKAYRNTLQIVGTVCVLHMIPLSIPVVRTGVVSWRQGFWLPLMIALVALLGLVPAMFSIRMLSGSGAFGGETTSGVTPGRAIKSVLYPFALYWMLAVLVLALGMDAILKSFHDPMVLLAIAAYMMMVVLFSSITATAVTASVTRHLK